MHVMLTSCSNTCELNNYMSALDWVTHPVTESGFNLLEVQEDPADQCSLDVPSGLSLHGLPGHPYHLLVLGVPGLKRKIDRS